MTVPSIEGTASLRATGLGKRLGQAWVLRDVTFAVDRGAIVALMGPNGAGKSTLLALLASILTPSAGEAWVLGRHLGRESSQARAAVGYLGHATGLYGGMTARENLWLAGKLFGVTDLATRVEEAMERAGLSHRPRYEVVRHHSKGMARRLALERAMLHRPALLLLDEPFEGLDGEARGRLEARLTEHRERGGSALVATHDAEQASRLCDRVLMLGDGRLA